jgi:hypothetical protein
MEETPIEKKRNHLKSASTTTGAVNGHDARLSATNETRRPMTNRGKREVAEDECDDLAHYPIT